MITSKEIRLIVPNAISKLMGYMVTASVRAMITIRGMNGGHDFGTSMLIQAAELENLAKGQHQIPCSTEFNSQLSPFNNTITDLDCTLLRNK
jgi:hypothetical protein